MKKNAIIFVLTALILAVLCSACGNTVDENSEPELQPGEADEAVEESVLPAEIETDTEPDRIEVTENEVADCAEEPAKTYLYNEVEYPDGTDYIVITETDGLEELLAEMDCLKTVDATACSITAEDVDRYQGIRPDVEIIWMVEFLNYRVRSDIECFSTLQGVSANGTFNRHSDADFEPLFKYCRHLKALDLGHNDIRDLTYIGQLTELQVLIIADQPYLTDISPLSQLKNLYYLEIFICNRIEDYSPLNELTAMQYINLCYNYGLDSESFIDNMPELKMAWLRATHVTKDMVQRFLDDGRDIVFLCGGGGNSLGSTDSGWRETECNRACVHAFQNWKSVKSFNYWDDIVYFEDGETE